MTGAFWNLSRATVWLDRGKTRRIDRGFARFEAWRDDVLAEEELEQHKLDRKIVHEEHWLRYGVSGRRKRNQARLGRSACASRRAEGRRARARRRGDGEARPRRMPRQSGKLVIEARG